MDLLDSERPVARPPRALSPRLFTNLPPYVPLAHRDYPLLWSLVTDWDIKAAGLVDLRVAPAQLAIFTVAFIAATMRILHGLIRPSLLSLTALLLVAAPEMIHETISGGADLVLGIYLSLFLLACVRWSMNGDRLSLLLALVFSASVFATKAEGTFELFAFLFVGTAITWRRPRFRLAPLWAVTGLGLL